MNSTEIQARSRVEVMTLDADSRTTLGTNQMGPATRIPATGAGVSQGKQEATGATSSGCTPRSDLR
jgi:NTE family protein